MEGPSLDLETLCFDSSGATMRPATAAVLGFMFWTLQERPALVLLGYLFHPEFLATHLGAESGAGLLRAGIPAAAITFFREHQGTGGRAQSD